MNNIVSFVMNKINIKTDSNSLNEKNEFNSNLSAWVSSSSMNDGKAEAVEKIQKAFEENASELDLSGLGLSEIPSCIGKLKKLKILYLNVNKLKSLPDEIGHLPELEILDLNYNYELKDLPQSLSKIPTLQCIFTGSTGISEQRHNEIMFCNRSHIVQAKLMNENRDFQKKSLLFSDRPPAVQDEIDRVYEKLSQQGNSWGHNGSCGLYYLLNFDERDVIAQRIKKSDFSKKDLYFIDLGAGNFSWVDSVKDFLCSEFYGDKRQFHVIGVTGEGEPFDHKKTFGNIITHKITGFKLENLLESFAQFDLQLVNSVEFIVTSWTLRHLVDPLGTLDQAYHLLNCGNGFLFGTGFDGYCPNTGNNSLSATLSNAFGIHSYIARRSNCTDHDSFALFRAKEDKHSYTKGNFEYNYGEPLSKLSGREDCYANCVANLKPLKFDGNVDEDFGGGFHGFGTYVLEQLLGHEEKKFIHGNTRYLRPLFKEGLGFCKMYLDGYNTYQVSSDTFENEKIDFE